MDIGETRELTIEEFFNLSQEEGGEFQIETPDGWQDIGFLVKKDNKECYNLILDNGVNLECSSSHQILTENGWVESENIDVNNNKVLTKNGFKGVKALESIGIHNTYDLNVISDEHSYYSNDIVSHNCGKSLCAKAVASLYEMPLLKLDFGRLFGSLVGESEATARDAIKLAESVAPCVSSDTEIDLYDGRTLTIEQILKLNEEKINTMSFDEGEMKITKDKIVAVIKQPQKKEMLKIDTWYNSIKVTLDHKLFVNRSGEIIQIPANKIQVGDLLLVPKKRKRNIKNLDFWSIFDKEARFFGKDIWANNKFNIKRKDFSLRKYRKSYYVKMSEVSNFDSLPESVSIGGGGYKNSNCCINFDLKKIYYLLGLIDSGGYISKKRTSIGFVNTDLGLHNIFKEIIKDVFGISAKTILNKSINKNKKLKGLSAKPKFKRCYSTYFNNKIVKNILLKAKESLLSQEDDLIARYLSGYFDGDGCIALDKNGSPRLIFCSKKEESWRRLRRCLHCLGVLSPGNQKGYSVCISSFENVVSLKEKMHINHREKKIKLANISLKNRFSSKRSRGYRLGNKLKTERLKYGMMSNSFDISSSFICDVENKDKIVSEDKLKRIRKILNKSELIDKFYNGDVIGVKVTGIEAIGCHDCYDLMIRNNHNFFANGILSKNCVLWADEIEKGLSGSQSSGQTDGGTTSRVISTFLTWMQEKESPVFIFCTANDHNAIPPEFMRAGRFDEVFFVDLPNMVERKEIYKVILRRYNRNPLDFNLDKLAMETENYSGSEIEKSVVSSLFEAFYEDERKIDTNDIILATKTFKPLYDMRKDSFDNMREWARDHCRLASDAAGSEGDKISIDLDI